MNSAATNVNSERSAPIRLRVETIKANAVQPSAAVLALLLFYCTRRCALRHLLIAFCLLVGCVYVICDLDANYSNDDSCKHKSPVRLLFRFILA